MEDLMAQLQNLLSTPQGQEQLKSVAGMLGVNPTPPPPQAPQQQTSGLDISSISGLLAGLNNNHATQDEPSQNAMPNIDMGMLLKAQQAFSNMNTNDDNSQLLLSLKPHFSEKRQKKIDQAINIMRMMKMLPLLTQSGLFGSNE